MNTFNIEKYQIIKDEDIANSYEYEKSVKASDLYILCVENNAKFEFFSFTRQDYINIGIVNIKRNAKKIILKKHVIQQNLY